MSDAIIDIKKSKKGRPKSETTPVMVRLPIDLVAKVDQYRREQPDLPGRPEAIRQILKAYFKG
ncbi:MAG: hypothetical protein NVV72_14650 [Asticcacaulis sp.]|nr:hypothetical protein [Asticcacaulis sp.]